MGLMEERLKLIREGTNDLYTGVVGVAERQAVRKRLNRREANYVIVSFRDNDILFLLSDKHLKNLDRRLHDDAVEMLQYVLDHNNVYRYVGHGKYQLVRAKQGNEQMGKDAHTSKMEEALGLGNFKPGEVITDIVEADDRLSAAQRKVGYTSDDEDDDGWIRGARTG